MIKGSGNCKRHVRFTGLLWLVLLLIPLSLPAQRYQFRYYSHRDGLKEPEVHALLQDRSGFLWVGTAAGLFRYDGVRFTRFGKPNVPLTSVESLAQTPDGTLWLGTATGLARLRGEHLEFVDPPGPVRINGHSAMAVDVQQGSLYVATASGLYVGRPHGSEFSFERYANPQEIADAAVHSVHVDATGIVWFGCGGSLCNLAAAGIQVFGRDVGVPSDRWDAIITDATGNLWIRSVQRLMVRPKGGRHFIAQDRGLAPATNFASLYLDREGRLFAPTESGLSWRTREGWETITVDQGLPTNPTCCVLQDREGSIWVGLDGAGLARWVGYDQWQSWTRAEGLAGNNLQAIHRDRAGVLWVGTESGLQRFGRDGRVSRPWTASEGLGGTKVRAIASASDGTVWVGSSPGGLSRLDPRTGSVARYRVGSTTQDSEITTILVDASQQLWVTTHGGLFRSAGNFPSIRLERQVLPLSSAEEIFNQVFVDSKQRSWFAGSAGLLCMNRGQWTRFTVREGLRSNAVDTVAEAPDGSIWIEYTDALGLSRMRLAVNEKPHLEHYSENHGLNSDEIASLQIDARGWIWASSNDGMDVFDGNKWRHYGQAQGLLWNDCASRSLYTDADGSVWIGTSRGLSRFHPPKHPLPSVPPPVLITSVQFGGRSLNPSPGMRIPYREHSAVIGFAGLSFLDESAVRFRYRLDGLEEAWVETNQREVHYPGLPVGAYTFEVQARNPEGVWSIEPARFTFSILAPWWQTGWAYLSLMLVLGVSVGAVWSWRVTHLKRDQRRLEMAVQERTRELQTKTAELQFKSHELELEQAKVLEQKARAEVASRLKSEFLANMSHEIRTPMNAILGMTALAIDTTTREEQQEYLEDVMSSAEGLLSLLNDILDLSKIEAGRMELVPIPISLIELLQDTTQFLRIAARQKGLEVTYDVAPDIPHQLLGDPFRLRQVLLNLIGNSIKFTDKGSVTVKAQIETEESDAFSIRFSVSDTGPGIPEDKQRIIFESFCQADGSISRKHGGTGLGLTISSRLVELMSGRISVQSNPAEGSTFHFTARLGKVCEGTALIPRKRTEPIHEPGIESEARSQLGSLNILVAEDNFSNLKLVTRMLEGWGQRVTIAVDGREALRLFEQQEFDVVLLDIQMPEMDGLETATSIRQRETKTRKRTPIIALTAHAESDFRDECLAAGMDHFLTKPLQPRKLFDALKRVAISQQQQS